MEKLELKRAITLICKMTKLEALANLEKEINDYQESSNEYGQARDRYDSFREQLANKRDMLVLQYQKTQEAINLLDAIDLSREFGIPPVYGVPFRALTNDTGRVVMQVFFYGDKDGMGIFQGFKRLFDPKLWKTTTTKNWIEINSTKGRPVSVYANLPLPEEDDKDKKAQDALDSFLLKNNLYPTVVIHRGHSYNAPYTIDQILPSAKIVFMGSCGGYYLIHDILKHSPDAHIITSKQIGKTAVNQPFFNLLMEKARNGSNIDWIPFWEELEKKVGQCPPTNF